MIFIGHLGTILHFSGFRVLDDRWAWRFWQIDPSEMALGKAGCFDCAKRRFCELGKSS
jgi:hypothetical protein